MPSHQFDRRSSIREDDRARPRSVAGLVTARAVEGNGEIPTVGRERDLIDPAGAHLDRTDVGPVERGAYHTSGRAGGELRLVRSDGYRQHLAWCSHGRGGRSSARVAHGDRPVERAGDHA